MHQEMIIGRELWGLGMWEGIWVRLAGCLSV